MGKKKLTCYITGQERQATPEEFVRQAYAKILVEDYGYDKKDLIFEYGVKRSPSDNKKSVPVDIAVIENGKPKIFVETKKESVKEGIDQLKNYMDWEPEIKFGVWTNSVEKKDDEVTINYIEKKIVGNKIIYDDVFNIPEKGKYTLQEQLRKRELKPTNNLKSIFKQMRGFIAANATGTTRDETILSELMAILMCKIYDERYKMEDDYVDFVVVNNDEKLTGDRIRAIYNEKVKIKYPMVFKETDSINLSDDIITYVVAQLQQFSVTKSSPQVVSNAFESIISYASKGSQGQFFTPGNVVQLMVTILKPERYKKLIDPAAGTAGFLTASMYYVWDYIDTLKLEETSKIEEKKEYAMSMLYGIEKDDFLAKISKAYMAILGDGKAGIHVEDSLNPAGWSSATVANIRDESFDYLLTNPPFGKDIKVKKKTSELYEFNDVDLIFIERSLQLLKDGGILGIILPETIFHSPTNKKVRDLFFYKHNIKAIVDIPHDTFRPYNNAKCDIIFVQKNVKQQKDILAIKVDNIGHDHSGETTYKYDIISNTFDESIVNDDIPHIIDLLNNDEYMYVKKMENKQESDFEFLSKFSFDKNIQIVQSEELIKSDVLVASNFFTPKPNASNAVSLGDLVGMGIIKAFDGHGSPKSYLKGKGDIPYVRVKDIVNLEVYINPLDLIPDFERDRLYKDDKELKERDIVFVRRGSYRIGDVGILYKKDINSILTREILVIRVVEKNNKYNITPYNLLYLLNSEEVRKQLSHKIYMDTTLPNIGERWKDLLIPIYSTESMDNLSGKMEKLYNSRSKFWEEYSKIEII